MTTPEVEQRAEEYRQGRSLVRDSCLGVGTQGSVFVFNYPSQTAKIPDQTAVKFHDRDVAYNRELAVFLRLRDLDITHVCGYRVPILIDYDDSLLAIEMTIVSPPFCLDFGGAYLDRPPDYSHEVWADWREMKAEAFGENWPAVENILNVFKSFDSGHRDPLVLLEFWGGLRWQFSRVLRIIHAGFNLLEVKF